LRQCSLAPPTHDAGNPMPLSRLHFFRAARDNQSARLDAGQPRRCWRGAILWVGLVAATHCSAGAMPCGAALSSPAGAPPAHNQGGGTVTDTAAGLMWQTCSVGQVWSKRGDGGSNCNGPAQAVHWDHAAQTVVAREYAGYRDWRLPTRSELQALRKRCEDSDTQKDATTFPAPRAGEYWTGEVHATDGGHAWLIDMGSGAPYYAPVASNAAFVRLVRTLDSPEPRAAR